jgi:ribosomal protein S20
MIRSELKTAMDAISRLRSKMKGEERDVEAWVQSKITKAADYLQAAANYIDSGESEVK